MYNEFLPWFSFGWQSQAQLGDGKVPKAVQPSSNPSDLRMPHAMEPQINVTQNLTYLNHAEFSMFLYF